MAMPSARVRKNERNTIPAEMRKQLNLQEGDVIYFDERGGQTVLIRSDDIISRTAGALKNYVTEGPVEIDRDKIWSVIAAERDNYS